ncbi:hypothetical protein ACFSCV_02235 [Methylopila henanensis]|uniref:DUF481 domain-containing protein n=1 Tax=Methylopila henanensis TaxID=873516 RepID=A0ABW4K268_9HYPH
MLAGLSSARAGAFTLPEGELKLFAVAFVQEGDQYFDRNGRPQPRDHFLKRELQLFGEYGWTDALTLFAAASLQDISVRGEARSRRTGLGRMELGFRRRLYSNDGWIVSAQASGLVSGARSSDDLAAIGETDDQVDIRALVARSFEAFGGHGFVDLQAGYRARFGDPADEARFDATLGWRRSGSRWQWLAQSFNTFGLSRWNGPYPLRQRIHKLQTGALYDLTAALSLYAAAFTTPAGRDALDERGLVLGLSCRF